MKYTTLIPYFGGKFSHLKFLLPNINNIPHSIYVEPFCGSCAVFFNKQKCQTNIINDKCIELINFFKILKSNPRELNEVLYFTPYSREEFANACFTNENDSEIERARKFFVRARQSRSGLATNAKPGQWSYTKVSVRSHMAHVIARYLSSINKLESISLLLENTVISDLDALEVINKYDSRDTLYYLDPPYLAESRKSYNDYLHEYSYENHKQLLNTIKNIKGKVVISSYDNELYRDELRDWEVKSSIRTTTANNTGEKRKELIWIKK